MCELLVHALDVASVDKDRLTHGFHSYPARMHWATPARLIEELELAGQRVLDPFCGSGTTLIEASVAGCTAFGVDLSPLSVRLSRVKTDPLTPELRQELLFSASTLRSGSEELVQARANVRAELPPGEIGWYEPHVLKEMAGLWGLIQALEQPPALREALRFVFSSLVVKFSRQRSDTSVEQVARRVRKGLVSEFFERKAFELGERLAALAEAGALHKPQVIEGDARALVDYVQTKMDCIICSPPYGGTYDYVEHHARRLAWLGITTKRMEAHELGARRRGDDLARFERELASALMAMRGALRKDGMAFLLMGDGEHRGQRVPADELVARLAPDVNLFPLAVASQERPDFLGGAPRAEHLMALVAR
jgi:SAM-dependent methyltransferase